jgi:predicted transcriptional regulator
MQTMPTSTFTTRIDVNLKERLQTIARQEHRSASFMANQAIEHFVEEREATRALVETGLMLIEKGAPTISSDAVHAWMNGPEDAPFPEPNISKD